MNSDWKIHKNKKTEPEKLLSSFNLEKVPVDIFQLSERLGLKVLAAKKEPNWSAALDLRSDVPIIWYRPEDNIVHQRFSIAHEIGHLMLHSIEGIHRDVTYSGNNMEKQANNYASRLLIPAKKLILDGELYSWNIKLLANKYEVSELAMRYRLRAFGFGG